VPLISTRVLILQTFPYSDTSKILRLFSLEHGLRSAIAKGALRPKSRFGGLLEPFTEGEAQLYLKEGRDLHTLGGFDLVRSRQALGRSLGAFAGASLASEIVLRFATEEPHPQLYEVLVRTLDRIAEANPPEAAQVALAGVWAMVSLLGYRPETRACIGCGRELVPEETARFDVEAGGVSCTRCRPRGRTLNGASRNELRMMVEGEPLEVPITQPGLHSALLQVFLASHLFQEHPLRSLDLFLEHLRDT
jgi:DNA repair protein RecO (recombination protein O)